MIIRAMANALIQCVTRTQPGWMTLPVGGVTCWSLTVRLDMADSSLASVTPLIRWEPAFCYRIGAIRIIDGGRDGHKKASRASAARFLARPVGERELIGRAGYDAGSKTVSTTWMTPFD